MCSFVLDTYHFAALRHGYVLNDRGNWSSVFNKVQDVSFSQFSAENFDLRIFLTSVGRGVSTLGKVVCIEADHSPGSNVAVA
jgi:hypothetical protein